METFDSQDIEILDDSGPPLVFVTEDLLKDFAFYLRIFRVSARIERGAINSDALVAIGKRQKRALRCVL